MNINGVQELTGKITNNATGTKDASFPKEAAETENFAEIIDPKKSQQSEKPQQSQQLHDNDNNTDKKALKKLKGLGIEDNLNLDIKNLNYHHLLAYSQDIYNQNNEYKIDLESLTEGDFKFIKQCVDNPNMTINSLNQQNLQVNFSLPEQTSEVSYRSLNFSKGLFNLIDYAYKTQRPIRLDFEGNSSVILKIDNEGKLSAQFISSDMAMEQILKNNIPHLRNRFDSEKIPYKEITYRDSNKRQNNKDNKGE